jgi:hypothetical protein
MESYSTIFVLSAVRLNSEGEFPNFEASPQNPEQEIYTGGGVRMEAMHKFSNFYPQTQIITVGGLESDHQTQFSKAKEMAEWLTRKNPQARVAYIDSTTSTQGNLQEIAKYLLEKEISAGSFALLTNEYHQQRIQALWKKLQQQYLNLPELNFITPEALEVREVVTENDPRYLHRQEMERQGISKIQSGEYVSFRGKRL